MAIIIPSKNVYSMQLDLIRDNGINCIDIEAYRTNISKTTNENVFGTTIGVSGQQQSEGYSEEYKSTQTSGGQYAIYPQAYAFADATIQYADFYLYIPRSTKNKYIAQIYTATDNEGNPQISISRVSGDMRKYSANRVVHYSAVDTDSPSYSTDQINYTTQEQEFDSTWDYLNDDIVASISKSQSIVTATANRTITPENHIPMTSQEQGNEFVVRIRVAVGYSITTLSGGASPTVTQGSYTATGEKVMYTAKTIEISVNGDYYEFDLEAVRKQVGDTNEKSYSVQSNELMQIENYYGVSSQNQLETAFTQTINNYKNGKETATIRCSINDYYDGDWAVISPNKLIYDVSNITLSNDEYRPEIQSPLPFDLIVELEVSSSSNGDYTTEAVIYKGLTYTDFFAADDESIVSARVLYADATPRMTFDIYDEVIPMVYGADGQDHPMSLKQDGTPKSFQVVGTKIFYDGAVWQELSLQEV